jgi:type IV secretion system protein VirD4
MSGLAYGESGSDVHGTVLTAAGSMFIAFSALVWAGAQLTFWLSGRGWAQASGTRAGAFLIELISGTDAGIAWGRAYPKAGALPSVMGFWLLSGSLLCFLVVLAAGVAFAWSGRLRRARGAPAHWASRREERRIAAPANPQGRPWRLVAGRGRASGRLLAGEDCVSAVVFGPNGSGKTTSLVVPNVLDWDGPVVMTTAKPQDLEPICSARRGRGPVWVLAPGGAPGHEVSGWSPVAAASDAEAADRVAEWLVESSGMTADPRSRPWNAQARKYLKGLLLAAHLSGASMRQWCDWMYAGEKARDQVEDVLLANDCRSTATEYESTFQIHDEGKGSVLFTAMGLADTYSRPGVMSAGELADFDPETFLNRSGTLCVVTPSGEGDRFAPYFTALITAIVHAAEQRAATAGDPLRPRLLLALDEAGNVFRYPRLPQLLTTSRGNGIQLLLIYHDLAQVEHLYGGREVARTVLSNAKLRILLPGVGDLDTLRYWSDLLGRTRTQTHGETHGADGHRSRSRNEHTEDLAPLHVLQQLGLGRAVLVYENLPPTRIDLLPWYRNRRYREFWTKTTAAKSSP